MLRNIIVIGFLPIPISFVSSHAAGALSVDSPYQFVEKNFDLLFSVLSSLRYVS